MHGTRGVVAMLLALSVAAWSAGQATRPVRSAAARAISRSTPHLTFTATISPAVIVPGARISIAIDVVPKRGMHVYAPGTQYRPVAIRLQADPSLRVRNPVYPKPTVYRFEPLNEDVLVYDGPFRLVVDVIANDASALRAHLRGRNQITIKGTLDYQACDDRMCYLPASVPFQWTLRVAGE
jgi:DsbC/DsbD-like thiol-disulfide interchange protein